MRSTNMKNSNSRILSAWSWWSTSARQLWWGRQSRIPMVVAIHKLTLINWQSWWCVQLLAAQSGAHSRGAFRGPTHTRPIPSIHPLITFEHLSLYIQKHLRQPVAVYDIRGATCISDAVFPQIRKDLLIVMNLSTRGLVKAATTRRSRKTWTAWIVVFASSSYPCKMWKIKDVPLRYPSTP